MPGHEPHKQLQKITLSNQTQIGQGMSMAYPVYSQIYVAYKNYED